MTEICEWMRILSRLPNQELIEAAEGYLMNARPHPGPLPQERVNHPPLSDDADTHGGRRCAGLKHKAAAAKWSKQFSGNAATLSLSLGERAGGRASVPLTFFLLCRQALGVTWQRSRRASRQLAEDRVPNCSSLAPETRVPKPQHLDAQRGEELLPLRVMVPLLWEPVLCSIQFNRQPRFVTEKIEGVFADRMLSVETAEPSPAQPAPHELFRPGRLLAENASGVGVQHGRHDSDVAPMKKNRVNARPHPGPLPQGEGARDSRLAEIRSEGRTHDSGARIARQRRMIHPLPGERAGVRASVSPLNLPPLSPPPRYLPKTTRTRWLHPRRLLLA